MDWVNSLSIFILSGISVYLVITVNKLESKIHRLEIENKYKEKE